MLVLSFIIVIIIISGYTLYHTFNGIIIISNDIRCIIPLMVE